MMPTTIARTRVGASIVRIGHSDQSKMSEKMWILTAEVSVGQRHFFSRRGVCPQGTARAGIRLQAHAPTDVVVHYVSCSTND